MKSTFPEGLIKDAVDPDPLSTASPPSIKENSTVSENSSTIMINESFILFSERKYLRNSIILISYSVSNTVPLSSNLHCYAYKCIGSATTWALTIFTLEQWNSTFRMVSKNQNFVVVTYVSYILSTTCRISRALLFGTGVCWFKSHFVAIGNRL